jgi:hypothetical protein
VHPDVGHSIVVVVKIAAKGVVGARGRHFDLDAGGTGEDAFLGVELGGRNVLAADLFVPTYGINISGR